MKLRNSRSRLSLRLKIWLYFIAFAFIVIVLLWFFQVFFLENFYEKMKVNDVREIAQKMADDFEYYGYREYKENIAEIARENELCVDVLNKNGQSIHSIDIMHGCLIHGPYNIVFDYIPTLQQSETGEICYIAEGDNKLLIYARVLGKSASPDGYLFLSARLAPVSATISIIKRQLLIIVIILIFVAFWVSLYVSEKIAEPIIKFTESASSLAEGDYTAEFVGVGYAEAGLLADTLNYARKEISKVDTLQRDLIANVSHDLRTPLTMIKAYAEMIRDLSGNNPAKRTEHLGVIVDETDRLASLVNDILDLTKLENGGLGLTLSTFGISGRLSEIIDRYNGISGKMDYHISFEPDEEREVTCDMGKIEQVLYNLINNAINYTGDDKRVYVRQVNLNDGVRIEVRDTGEGIDENNIKLIFDKYYRSENHKRETVGTGLGLSIVKAILKLHNYEYGVQSTIGEGSTFWFKISLNP